MQKETTKNGGVEHVEKSEVALREEEIQAFWKERDIFKKSVETPAGKEPVGDFVFYDGPPFATGTPHYGHILAGAIKDAIPRYHTMRGKRVVRKWGWDCHGLPLENIIEKRLGLSTKRDIEEMGVKKFNEAAREAVLEYADDWKVVVPRMGRFVDMEDDYRTMDATYTESVWWVFHKLNELGLVYEGYKSMHLCPRCGTTLSNFEGNLGYKDIKDIAVTVKLPLLGDDGSVTDTSLLVWTTTPWTLPGNMAAAVHNDHEYVKVAVTIDGKTENVILAKERLVQLEGACTSHEILETMKGKALVGKRYEPPFDVYKNQEFKDKENAWKIYHADYVELGTDGTGAVHLAPAYGEEDMELAKREGVPLVHHVGEDGRFKDFVTHFAGQLVKPKDDEKADVSHLDADIEVVKRLKDAGKLMKKENITHSYPHCWRCDTPLLNYATTSWFVRVTDIKDKLVAENAKVKWVPEHVGTNRFGKWLEGARDWAVSRQRYWGAPLPIWRREDGTGYKVIGSLEELKSYIPKSGNTYFKMRHGEADHNVSHIMSSSVQNDHHLTEKGVEQVRSACIELKDKHIDYLYVSPLIRTRETAAIVAEELGIPEERIIVDDRLHENLGGIFEGKPVSEWYAYRNSLSESEKVTHAYEGGESWIDIRKRMLSVLFEVEKKHTNKNILFISHGMPLRLMKWGAENVPDNEMVQRWEEEGDIGTGSVNSIHFVPFPHNDNYELDFHRPYIDEVELRDTDGTRLVRIPDVFDCWFESGSMPYAQHHYPFENTETFLKDTFPANFIAEGLDQTRGWFYSLIVLGTALFGKSPFQHVIVNGLALAEDGKKMSKSLQNYPDPMELMNRVGADAMRFYLLSSPVVRAEDLAFSEKEVLELQRKNIGRLHNVLAMYEMYQDGTAAGADSTHVLDRWMLARVNETVRDITTGYEGYELDRATRPLESLIDDLSVWYLRRSRERLKGADESDKQATLATLRHTLKTIALLMAPVMPFYGEYLFQRVKEGGDAESVHLMGWPKGGEVDTSVIEGMRTTREIVTLGLEARQKANIKVRQPLSALHIMVDLSGEYCDLVCDEVNVKSVLKEGQVPGGVQLDTKITPELKIEGEVRELMRAIQDARKEIGLMPQDRILLTVDIPTKLLIETNEAEVLRTVGATQMRTVETPTRMLEVNGIMYRFEVEKV